jgi:hypothetical protein
MPPVWGIGSERLNAEKGFGLKEIWLDYRLVGDASSWSTIEIKIDF